MGGEGEVERGCMSIDWRCRVVVVGGGENCRDIGNLRLESTPEAVDRRPA